MRVGKEKIYQTSKLISQVLTPNSTGIKEDHHSERFDSKNTVLIHMEFLEFTASCAVCKSRKALSLKVGYQEKIQLANPRTSFSLMIKVVLGRYQRGTQLPHQLPMAGWETKRGNVESHSQTSVVVSCSSKNPT